MTLKPSLLPFALAAAALLAAPVAFAHDGDDHEGDIGPGPVEAPFEGGPDTPLARRVIVQGTNPGGPGYTPGLGRPTSIALSPDKATLYLAERFGKIRVYALDAHNNATLVRTVDTIAKLPNRNFDGSAATTVAGRQVTGIALAQEAGEPVLYVSHSDPRMGGEELPGASQIDPASGAITKLSGPDLASALHLVTGLPRSAENHAPNGMAMGPDGWLYITLGSNTNFGAQSFNFSYAPEVPLSAAVARVNVSKFAGPADALDASIGSRYSWEDPCGPGETLGNGCSAGYRLAGDANGDDDVLDPGEGDGTVPGKFELYATGFRNPYDITWHSNGQLYLNDNEGNAGYGEAPACSPAKPAGTPPDQLFRVQPGQYHGHPNPARGECAWGTVPPGTLIAPYGSKTSTNGIAEYTSNAFGAKLKGQLLAVNFAMGDNLVRTRLAPGGSSAAEAPTGLVNQLANPLDVAVSRVDGSIFVAEYGGGPDNPSTVTLFQPAGACQVHGGTADADGDGAGDGEEAAHGTDACDPANKPGDHTDGDHDHSGGNDDHTDGDHDHSGGNDDALGREPQGGGHTAADACAPVAARPKATKGGTIELSAAQLLISQRISQAAMRRADAIARWLDDGIVAGDICGGTLTAAAFGEGVTTGSASGPASAHTAKPRPLPAARTMSTSEARGRVTVSAAQLRINQRIAQAAVRRLSALEDRLDGGLTGGDLRDGQIAAGLLAPGLRIVSATPMGAPAAASPAEAKPASRKRAAGKVTVTSGQLRINQRIAQAAVRRANALQDRLAAGLTGTAFKPGSLTADDLGQGMLTASPPPARPHDGMVTGTVWIANEGDDSLTAIDASRNEVLTTLTGIPGPHNLQVSPDGASVWAASGHTSQAVAIDAAGFGVWAVVPTGRQPAHIIVTPDGRTVYASDAADDTVTAIDVATATRIATIPVGAFPHGLRPSPDGRWVYVTNAKGTTLSVIDTATNRRVADVEVGKSPVQVAFSPDGRFVYASLGGEDAVAKVDVATRRLVGKVPVGDGPVQTYVSPDGRYLLVANQGTEALPGTTVSILDTATFTVVRTVETGRGAHGIVIDPSSRHAYVTNLYDDDVAVVDLAEQRVVARIPVGDKPNGISISSVVPPGRLAATIALALPEGHEPTEETGGHSH